MGIYLIGVADHGAGPIDANLHRGRRAQRVYDPVCVFPDRSCGLGDVRRAIALRVTVAAKIIGRALGALGDQRSVAAARPVADLDTEYALRRGQVNIAGRIALQPVVRALTGNDREIHRVALQRHAHEFHVVILTAVIGGPHSRRRRQNHCSA